MSSSMANHVQKGLWTDYTQRFGFQTQLLVTNTQSNIITNLLGILVTIACARVFRIFLRILELTGHFHDRPVAPESFAWRNARSFIDVLSQGAIHLGPQQAINVLRRRESLRFFGMAFALFALFAAFLACGVVTGFFATSTLALSDDPACGLYVPRVNGWPGNENISLPYEYSAQLESDKLTDSCLSSDIPECGLFIPPTFHVTVENTTCPFPDHICFNQGIMPIRISTGAVSAREIGINSPSLLEFNRTAACSPLNMNRTYINLAKRQENKQTFGYYYGHNDDFFPASYETIRRGDRGDLPSYEVAALWSDGLMDDNPWKPIPELVPPVGSELTLLIIVSQKINYLEPSSDPIFPANDTMRIPGDPRTYYINLWGPGTALACLERTEYRDKAIDSSWRPLTQLPSRQMLLSPNMRALYFLINSLADVNIFSSINLRLSAALNAQSRMTGFVSLPLANEQWKVEVSRLFNMSLARIMIHARDISRGAKGQYDGFVRTPKDGVYICDRTYLVQTLAWKNINFTGMMWSLTVSIVVFGLAVPITRQTPLGEEDALFMEVVWERFWASLKWVGRMVMLAWMGLEDAWRRRPRGVLSWASVKRCVRAIFTC